MSYEPQFRGWPKGGYPPFMMEDGVIREFTDEQIEAMQRAVNQIAERLRAASLLVTSTTVGEGD